MRADNVDHNYVSAEDFDAVGRIYPFSSIPKDLLSGTLACARTEEYRAGDVVADETAFPRGLCFVMEGVIIAENRSEKHVIALNAFFKGDIFGAATLFREGAGKYTSLVVAKKPTRLVIVPEETVKQLILKSPDFALSYVEYLSGKIRFLNKKLTGYTSKSSVRVLLQYLEVACAESDDGTAKINISTAAGALGMSRTTIYAAAEDLERGGFIKREGKYYTLLRV